MLGAFGNFLSNAHTKPVALSPVLGNSPNSKSRSSWFWYDSHTLTDRVHQCSLVFQARGNRKSQGNRDRLSSSGPNVSHLPRFGIRKPAVTCSLPHLNRCVDVSKFRSCGSRCPFSNSLDLRDCSVWPYEKRAMRKLNWFKWVELGSARCSNVMVEDTRPVTYVC